ncbi:MAG: hypothetical protein LRZ96_00390 [Candidatus Pacebacteria bacterium]|nr:hypothetical protein [Candidatus Paceibacterota bacterium]
MELKDPDRLYCDKKDKSIYDNLKEEGPFKKKDLIDIFMVAMAIGFKHKNRIKLTKKEGIILFKSFEANEKKPMTIIKAIAINETGNLDILLDKRELFSIAEEYATGGINILREEIGIDYESYIRQLETELIEMVEKNIIFENK